MSSSIPAAPRVSCAHAPTNLAGEATPAGACGLAGLDRSHQPVRSRDESGTDRFSYQVEVTIYEGDWGVYYPARFELWFVPESGLPERKLLEDSFRIEGWQR